MQNVNTADITLSAFTVHLKIHETLTGFTACMKLEKENEKQILPDRELNPGLPRDRRGY